MAVKKKLKNQNLPKKGTNPAHVGKGKGGNRHNLRSFLNIACTAAVEIVGICQQKTSKGISLDDELLKNFKVATDLIVKARQLQLQAKSIVSLEPAQVTNNILTATSSEELKALLSKAKE